MVTKKEEQEVFEDNLKEVVEESKKPEPTGKPQGIAGIVVGVIGLILPSFLPIIAGAIAATLGFYANHHGKRTLGIICGILALIDMGFFFLSIAGMGMIF